MEAPTPSLEPLHQILKRCSEGTLQAAVAFRESRDPASAAVVALGVIERFVESKCRALVFSGNDTTHLAEDLGIDSLLMIEIVVRIEDALELTIENEELRTLQTIGDVRAFISKKAS